MCDIDRLLDDIPRRQIANWRKLGIQLGIIKVRMNVYEEAEMIWKNYPYKSDAFGPIAIIMLILWTIRHFNTLKCETRKYD